jgi:hypothetical protein
MSPEVLPLPCLFSAVALKVGKTAKGHEMIAKWSDSEAPEGGMAPCENSYLRLSIRVNSRRVTCPGN